MFKKSNIAVFLLVLSSHVGHSESSVLRPSKEGLPWADTYIEDVVEYFSCVQAPDLYDLDWIAYTPEYQLAQTTLERADVVYQKFLERKLQIQKANALKIKHWNLTNLLAGGGIIGTVFVGYNYGFNRLSVFKSKTEELPLGNNDKRDGNDKRKFYYEANGNVKYGDPSLNQSWITLPSLFWAWTGGLIGGSAVQDFSLPLLVKRLISSWFYTSLEAPMQDVYIKTEEAYARHYFPMKAANPQLLTELKRNMEEWRENLGRATYFYNELVTTATKLPLQQGKFVFDRQNFEERYRFYPSNIKKVLTNIMGRMCFFGERDTAPTTNFPLYFQGVPGSGKTYAVNNITKITGAPVSHITLDGGTIEEIIGTKYGKPGRLLTALINGSKSEGANFSNGVLFIDEFDRLLSDSRHDPSAKALLSFMLKMLDPSNRRFFSPYLNCYVDLPSTIILAGNYEIKDPALANRFQIVKFDGYDEELKWGIAKEHLAPKVAKIYGFEEVKEEDLEAIHEIVLDDIEDGGVRSVELEIIKYFEEKRMLLFLDTPES